MQSPSISPWFSPIFSELKPTFNHHQKHDDRLYLLKRWSRCTSFCGSTTCAWVARSALQGPGGLMKCAENIPMILGGFIPTERYPNCFDEALLDQGLICNHEIFMANFRSIHSLLAGRWHFSCVITQQNSGYPSFMQSNGKIMASPFQELENLEFLQAKGSEFAERKLNEVADDMGWHA